MIFPTPQEHEEKKEKPAQPELPPEFFMDLLDLPSCKTIGICDECGRCEH